MLAIALAFGSAVSWGLADFLGGLKARRVAVLVVLLVSQATGLVAVAVLVAVLGDAVPSASELAPAVIAGAAGAAALAAFYRALAIGTMSIVAPISATGAALPAVAGIATGDRPGVLQLAGMGVAIAGVVLASREAHEDEGRALAARRSVALALLAALGIGTFLTLMDSAADAGVAWALMAARSTSVGLVLVAALAVRSRPPSRADLPALALVGLLDVSANALYTAATTEGLLSIVGVLGSLYPAATVILARVFLGERLRRVQQAGIALALAGVALIAGG